MKTTKNHSQRERGGAITSRDRGLAAWLLPACVAILVVAVWFVLSRLNLVPASILPSPGKVAESFFGEIRSGRWFDDIVASLFRVTTGFAAAVILGLPLGLWLGGSVRARLTLLPYVNFLRSLSPLAWIPFALLLFGIGDAPAIFLVFMAAVCPLTLATMSAVGRIPAVFFQVAREYEISGGARWFSIILPAIAPDVITGLRLTVGLSWLVVVAAEMLGCRDGLGYAVWDSRNGLRMDLLIVAMITIGLIGVIVDRLLVRLTRIPSVRWGYER